MVISKLGFLMPLGVNVEANLVKVDKNLRMAQVWCKSMKKVVSAWLWPHLTFGQPRVDLGHFGQFDLKWHFECLNAWISCAMSIWMFPRPLREKIIFLEFSGFAHKSRVVKIRCLQLPFLYFISRVQWEVSDKEHNSTFCCLKITCKNCVVHGSGLVLLDKVELLQLVWRNFLT